MEININNYKSIIAKRGIRTKDVIIFVVKGENLLDRFEFALDIYGTLQSFPEWRNDSERDAIIVALFEEISKGLKKSSYDEIIKKEKFEEETFTKLDIKMPVFHQKTIKLWAKL